MIQNLEKPVTRQYLAEFTKKILLPEIDTIFDEKLKQTKDEILTSNDKLSKKLDKILKEQAACAYPQLSAFGETNQLS